MKPKKPTKAVEFKPVIPANIDPIKLADNIKKGITIKFFKDAEEVRKNLKSRPVGQS